MTNSAYVAATKNEPLIATIERGDMRTLAVSLPPNPVPEMTYNGPTIDEALGIAALPVAACRAIPVHRDRAEQHAERHERLVSTVEQGKRTAPMLPGPNGWALRPSSWRWRRWSRVPAGTRLRPSQIHRRCNRCGRSRRLRHDCHPIQAASEEPWSTTSARGCGLTAVAPYSTRVRPVVFLVSNNSGLGMVRDNLGTKPFAVDFSEVDFAAMAEAGGGVNSKSTTPTSWVIALGRRTASVHPW